MPLATFSLSYAGGLADEAQIDFYDISQALIGFERSLALTAHAVINDEVITQAPSLKGAHLIVLPFEPGSWKVTTLLVAGITAASHLLTAPRDTPMGNLISSAYDYVISEILGFHVDYSRTLGWQYEDLHPKSGPGDRSFESRLDSVIEKVHSAVINIHRPIVHSETAVVAEIEAVVGDLKRPIGKEFNKLTYDFINYSSTSEVAQVYTGMVSSYNINTFRGRIFSDETDRPLPFILSENSRDRNTVSLITSSLNENARAPGHGRIRFNAYKSVSRSGQLKGYYIISVG
jgi:hypothetical protein